MTKEEKQAIEYYKNKEISFTFDCNTEELLKKLGIETTEEDSFENHQIRFETLLNLIEKQQKEIEETKIKRFIELCNSNLKKNIDKDYIPKSAIREKIEELYEQDKEWTEELSEPDSNFKIIDTNLKRIKNQIDILQELLEEK